MDHHGIADVDSHMANARSIVCPDEKHEVARLRVGNRGGNVVKSLCAQPARIAHAAVCQHPAHKAGAVKGGRRAAAAPHIGVSQILFCFRDNGGKGFVLHCRGRNFISLRAVCDVLRDVLAIPEQLRLVAQHRHIQRIFGQRFFVHDIDGEMREIEVFQLDGADVVVIRNFYLILIALAVCSGNGAVAHLGHDGFRENILLFKEHLQRPAHLACRPCAVMQRGEDRCQNIGIVLDLVKVIVVFVVIMGAFIGVEIFLQLGFQRTVGGFGGENVRVLRLIAGCSHTSASRAHQRRAGLQPADQHDNQQETSQNDQHTFPMAGNELRCFLCLFCRFFRCRRGGFCGFFGTFGGCLRGAARSLCRSRSLGIFTL